MSNEQDQIRELQEKIGAQLEPEVRRVLDVAADHRFDCTCDTCLSFWAHVGPEGDEAGCYGPFSREQVNARQRELGVEVTP